MTLSVQIRAPRAPVAPIITIGAGDVRLLLDALRAARLNTVGELERALDLIDLFSASIPQPEPREAQHDRPVKP